MPLYEYECAACGHRFEIIQKFSDGPPEACPKCGKGPLQRLMSSPAIQFKGTGWYVTDYAGKKGGSDGGSKDAKPAAKTESSSTSDSSSETKKSDTPAPASPPAKSE
jgi:putative FmdB family regulatory protein